MGGSLAGGDHTVWYIEKHMNPGRVIREQRRRAGVSQKALALRAGTSQAAISDIERGRTSPTFDTVERLLLCLGCEARLDIALRPMDADIETLRATRALGPRGRMQRITGAGDLVARGRRALAGGRS
jgi:hypothetical protein